MDAVSDAEAVNGRLAARMVRAVVGIVATGLVVVVAASVIPVWPLALFEHFRVQYTVVGLAAVIGCSALRMRGTFDGALIAWLVNAALMVTGLQDARPIPAGTPLRVLSLNVHTESSAFGEVARLITDTQPDVIGLVEVDQRWLDALAPALAGYARLENPEPGNAGVALYARGTVDGQIEWLGGVMPSVVANVQVGRVRLGVIVTHPFPPTSRERAALHEHQLLKVARRSRELGTPVMIMGDFNATPWSRLFARVVATSGLCDTRDGFGIQATFPVTSWPSWIVRIPIDHVLVSCALGVRDRRVGRDVGSDHFPVVVDLVVPD